MKTSEFFKAAEWLAAQNLPLFPLVGTQEVLTKESALQLKQLQAGLLADRPAVIFACPESDPRTVFLSASSEKQALAEAHGRCRYLAETAQEIQTLDATVGPFLPEGYMEDIAIRVWPNGGGAFTADNIPTFARLIRRTEHLAVRGLFLPFDRDGDLSRQAKDAFSLVKKIRSDMPCMLHAFCFEGLLEPLAGGDAELLHTLRMLASLNDTSLYASFFIS